MAVRLRVKTVGVAIEDDVDTSTAGSRNDSVLKSQIKSDNTAHDDDFIIKITRE